MNSQIIGKITVAATAYFAPINEIMAVMLLFVGCDLVAGIGAARKQKIACSSRRLRQSVVKLICYLATVTLLYVAEKTFDMNWMQTHKFIGGFICTIELVSILENLALITEKPIFIAIIRIIRGTRSSSQKIVDEIMNEKIDRHVQK